MKPEELEIPAIHGPLIDSGCRARFPRILSLGNNPGVLIRPEDNLLPYPTSLDQLRTVSGLLSELDTTYGIKNPGYAPFITGKEAAQIVTSRVYGVNLEQYPEIDVSAVAQLYGTLATYLGDKLANGQEFMLDIFGSYQYLYGHTDEDPKAKIYLSDFENLTDSTDTASHYPYESFTRCARNLYEDIMNTTEKTGVHFDAIDTLMGVVDAIPNTKITARTKEILGLAYAEQRNMTEDEMAELRGE